MKQSYNFQASMQLNSSKKAHNCPTCRCNHINSQLNQCSNILFISSLVPKCHKCLSSFKINHQSHRSSYQSFANHQQNTKSVKSITFRYSTPKKIPQGFNCQKQKTILQDSNHIPTLLSLRSTKQQFTSTIKNKNLRSCIYYVNNQCLPTKPKILSKSKNKSNQQNLIGLTFNKYRKSKLPSHRFSKVTKENFSNEKYRNTLNIFKSKDQCKQNLYIQKKGLQLTVPYCNLAIKTNTIESIQISELPSKHLFVDQSNRQGSNKSIKIMTTLNNILQKESLNNPSKKLLGTKKNIQDKVSSSKSLIDALK